MASPLKIRPHHLLCLLGFRGSGYSQEFVLNMGKAVEELRFDPTLPITLVVGCDAICADCPHNRNGKCLKEADSEAKVISLDLVLLSKLGFEVGDEVSTSEAWERIKERITSEDMADLCRDCEWWILGYCVQGLERIKQTNSC